MLWFDSTFHLVLFQWFSNFSVHHVVQSLSQCRALCDPMDCSTPGLSVPHYLLEFAQVHVHWVGDAIQLSHPVLTSSPFALSLSQHQGPFKWVHSLHQVAKVLEFQLQQSVGISASASVLPMNIQDWSPLGWTGWISLQSKGLSKSLLQHHSSKASILRHSAFFIVQLSYPYMTTGKTIALTRWTFVGKVKYAV